MRYKQIKEEYQRAYNAAFVFWIITTSQEEAERKFKEALEEYSLNESDVISFGAGGYTTKEGLQQIEAAAKRKKERIQAEVLPDKKELTAAFKSLMLDYEYCFMDDADIEPHILKPLGLSWNDINGNVFYGDCYDDARRLYYKAIDY